MNLGRNIVRVFVVSVLMAAFILFYVKPTIQISPEQYGIAVVIIEIIAGLLAYTISKGGWTRTGIQILAVSFIFSALIVMIFKPAAAGWDKVLLGTTAIEFVGLIIASAATSSKVTAT